MPKNGIRCLAYVHLKEMMCIRTCFELQQEDYELMMEDEINFVMIDKVEGTEQDMVGVAHLRGCNFIHVFIHYCRENV